MNHSPVGEREFICQKSTKKGRKEIMHSLAKIMFVTVLGVSAVGVTGCWAADPTPAAPPPHEKNWTPPKSTILAQALSDKIMASHPELLSCTFHGVPPGAAPGTYTMFAGSYPDRIGNVDDPDDVDIQKLGITIVDPRWHRVNDTVKKFVMMLPLHDAQGENVGELVLAYKNDASVGKGEKDFFLASTALRDSLASQIPNLAALFAPAK